MTKDMMPVARISLPIHAYQASHIFSRKLSETLYLEISSKEPQYVSCAIGVRTEVEFLWRMSEG
jgi:hypothetical protein